MLRTLSKALWRESFRYFFQCQFGWRCLSQFRRFRFLIQLPYFYLLLRQLCLLIWHLLALVQQWLCSSHDMAVRFIRYWKRLFPYKWDSQLSFPPSLTSDLSPRIRRGTIGDLGAPYRNTYFIWRFFRYGKIFIIVGWITSGQGGC